MHQGHRNVADGPFRWYFVRRHANHHVTLPSLPCYPCPHEASCCAFGTTVSEEEAAAIEANHGPGLVYETRWGELRTRVRNRRCVLFRDGGCSVHDKPYYPTTCQGFPWVDGDTGERYEYDVTICGEFERRPELIELRRAIPPAG
jgi:hypothetical protein